MPKIRLSNAWVSIPVLDYSAKKMVRGLQHRKIKNAVEKDTVTHAIRNLSLSINDGDRIGLIGSNGAGKTSLLRLLSGVYSPSAGIIEVDGEVHSLLDITFGIEPDLTGREAIGVRATLMGLSRKTALELEDEIVSFSGLGEMIDWPTRTYSSGMFVRLSFSIATVVTPEILVMDEWLSVGDEDFKDKARTRLAELVDSSRILIVASHSRELIEKTCTRALWIRNGEVHAEGSPHDVCAQYFGPTGSRLE